MVLNREHAVSSQVYSYVYIMLTIGSCMGNGWRNWRDRG